MEWWKIGILVLRGIYPFYQNPTFHDSNIPITMKHLRYYVLQI
jgi:hypothetical protein